MNNDYNGNRKIEHTKTRIVFSSLVLLFTILIQMYWFINYPRQYEIIFILLAIVLLDVYVLLTAIFTFVLRNKEIEKEDIGKLLQAEKASYLMLKKNFLSLEKKIDLLEKVGNEQKEEIIETQKYVGKISINRNKEGIQSLLKITDKVVQAISIIGNQDVGSEALLLENQKELLAKQQELLDELKRSEIAIQRELLQGIHTISTMQPRVYTNPEMVMTSKESLLDQSQEFGFGTEEATYEQEATHEQGSTYEPLSPDDIAALLANAEDIIPQVLEPEPEPEPEEKPAMPDLSDPNKPMSPEDIAALLANMGNDAPLEPEPEPEEKPAMPDLSDPNKPMSPEDIAALLANMGNDAPLEPEPEEKPAMPDLSDPNKAMSPEDIAALFANM